LERHCESKQENPTAPDKDRFYWKSGCFQIDPRMTLFSAQLLISLLILIFCLSKLYKSDTCEAQSLYGNIIITLVGLWMPSPLNIG
jgi:hypothetical protein